MGIGRKGKRKITVGEKVYWWFVKEDRWGEPLAHIVADNHSLVASCNLYCPVLNIIKDPSGGGRVIPVPFALSDQYLVFTPGYIQALIGLAEAGDS